MDSSEFSLKKILTTFSLLSTSTVAAILFSALTTKILATVAGVGGVALMGLYRNVGALVVGALTLGYGNIIVQLVSIANSKEKSNDVIHASLLLFLLQCSIGIAVVLFIGPTIAYWVLGHPPSAAEVFDMRVVVLMSLINLALQAVTLILKGQSAIKWLTVLQPVTAIASFCLIYPLLKLGSLGLAINVGSGSIVGCLIGIIAVKRTNEFSFSLKGLLGSFSLLRSSSLPSFIITFEALATLGALLGVQTLINRTYGLDPLGNYNAAFLIIDTGTLLLMSSVRAYFLPSLGKMESELEKQELVMKIMAVLLSLGIIGALFLILASGIIVPILFTGKFVMAAKMLSLFSLSMIGLVFLWTYNALLLHKGDHWQYVLLDCACYVLLIGGSFWVCNAHLSVYAIPVCYAVSCSITGLLYTVYVTTKYGVGYLSKWNALLAMAGYVLIALAVWSMTNQKSLSLSGPFRNFHDLMNPSISRLYSPGRYGKDRHLVVSDF